MASVHQTCPLLRQVTPCTYIVIPARNAQSREVELDRVTEWAQRNNLKLNRAKSVEIIFEDRRRKSQAQYPPALPDIHRYTNQDPWSNSH